MRRLEAAVPGAAGRARRRQPLTLPLGHPIQPLLDAAWGLRSNLRVLDALYVALAQRRGCQVLTTDSRLAAAAPGSTRLVTSG